MLSEEQALDVRIVGQFMGSRSFEFVDFKQRVDELPQLRVDILLELMLRNGLDCAILQFHLSETVTEGCFSM